jgi:TrmH family RNA methyltransferase
LYDLIASKENRRVKTYGLLATSRRARAEAGQFVLEGRKLLLEAIRSKVEICEVFASSSQCAHCEEMLVGQEVLLHEITPAVEDKLRQSQAPQGIYAICRMLDKRLSFDTIDDNGCYLGLWDLQDPGNIGTIIRTADAMGLSGLVMSENCCDLYNGKVVRAAMGSLFRMPVLVTDMDEFLRVSAGKLTSFAAVVDQDAPSILSQPIRGGILVVGNEGNGLSPEQVSRCIHRVTIPMPGNAESLNAATAASLFMWEMTKIRLEEPR